MRVVAIMSWYDEPDEVLAEAVRSLAGLADHLICLDGRYALFHGPTNSPATNYLTITRAALDAGLSVQVESASEPWDGPHGGEVAKRNRLFELAEAATSPTDWLLSWDADFVLDRELSNPSVARAVLEQTRKLAADVWLFQDTLRRGGCFPDLRLRILFRALRGLRVEHTHWQYVAPHPWQPGKKLRLWDMANRTVPSAPLYQHLFVHHVPDRRDQARDNRRWAYYMLRDNRRVEQPEIDPATPRLLGDAAPVV